MSAPILINFRRIVPTPLSFFMLISFKSFFKFSNNYWKVPAVEVSVSEFVSVVVSVSVSRLMICKFAEFARFVNL